MALPKFFEFFEPFLRALSDGEVHTPREVRDYIAREMNLSDEDMSIMLPSGRITCFYSRVGWARTYLDKAGLLETPSRAKYRITDEGKSALRSGERIDLKYLERYEVFRKFHANKTNDETSSAVSEEEEKTPLEILDDAFEQINSTVSDQLMTEVMKLTPTDFEHLVVQLLLKMGYGSGIDDDALVTQPSNDGGIDGIIKEDRLGFSSIYIQAKQWDPSRTVDRPEIQKFAGALHERNGAKGLFITTAGFSSGAHKSAEAAGIVLVDGKQLTKLMINYNLGVSVEHVYEVKRIDSDFFSEGF